MADQNYRHGPSPQQSAEAGYAAEGTRIGRDDPAPAVPDPDGEKPTPPPRRDNQGEAVTGAPVVV